MATPSTSSNKSTTSAKPQNGTKGASTSTATDRTPETTPNVGTVTTTPATGTDATTAKKRGGKSNVPYKTAKLGQLARAHKILANFAKKTLVQAKKEGAPAELSLAASGAAQAATAVMEASATFGKLADGWAPAKSAGARNRGPSIPIGTSVWITKDKWRKYEFALPEQFVRAPMVVEKVDAAQVAVRMADKILRVFPKVHVQLTDPAVDAAKAKEATA